MNTDTVIISREEYENLLKANAELAQQVKDLSEAVALLRQQRFGSSSEKNKVGDGSEQLSFLFNEPEVYADAAGASVPREPDLTTVKEHTRKKRAVNSEVLPEDVEIETTNEKSSGEKRVIREKMSLASFPWKGNSNKPLSSKKIAGVRTRGKESRSVAA